MLAEAAVDDRIAPTAIVTGGAGGIGKAVCELLAKDGYLIVVADRDEVGARAVADACGGFAFAVNVADESSVVGMVRRAVEALDGRVDALVTTASAGDVVRVEGDDVAAFARVHAVHVLGTYLCIREAAAAMEGGARICTVAPVAGNHGAGLPPGALHAAARGAVLALTRHAAEFLRDRDITVNGVAPGERSTSPLGVAEAVVWLLSPRASTINGEILTLDGPT